MLKDNSNIHPKDKIKKNQRRNLSFRWRNNINNNLRINSSNNVKDYNNKKSKNNE